MKKHILFLGLILLNKSLISMSHSSGNNRSLTQRALTQTAKVLVPVVMVMGQSTAKEYDETQIRNIYNKIQREQALRDQERAKETLCLCCVGICAMYCCSTEAKYSCLNHDCRHNTKSCLQECPYNTMPCCKKCTNCLSKVTYECCEPIILCCQGCLNWLKRAVS